MMMIINVYDNDDDEDDYDDDDEDDEIKLQDHS